VWGWLSIFRVEQPVPSSSVNNDSDKANDWNNVVQIHVSFFAAQMFPNYIVGIKRNAGFILDKP
jgi:hypothetical protein